jgi:hypothetical protein
MDVPPLAAQASKPGLEIAPIDPGAELPAHPMAIITARVPSTLPAYSRLKRGLQIGARSIGAMRMQRGARLALTSVPIAIVRPMHPIAGNPIGSLPAPEPDARRARHADAEPRR